MKELNKKIDEKIQKLSTFLDPLKKDIKDKNILSEYGDFKEITKNLYFDETFKDIYKQNIADWIAEYRENNSTEEFPIEKILNGANIALDNTKGPEKYEFADYIIKNLGVDTENMFDYVTQRVKTNDKGFYSAFIGGTYNDRSPQAVSEREKSIRMLKDILTISFNREDKEKNIELIQILSSEKTSPIFEYLSEDADKKDFKEFLEEKKDQVLNGQVLSKKELMKKGVKSQEKYNFYSSFEERSRVVKNLKVNLDDLHIKLKRKGLSELAEKVDGLYYAADQFYLDEKRNQNKISRRMDFFGGVDSTENIYNDERSVPIENDYLERKLFPDRFGEDGKRKDGKELTEKDEKEIVDHNYKNIEKISEENKTSDLEKLKKMTKAAVALFVIKPKLFDSLINNKIIDKVFEERNKKDEEGLFTRFKNWGNKKLDLIKPQSLTEKAINVFRDKSMNLEDRTNYILKQMDDVHLYHPEKVNDHKTKLFQALFDEKNNKEANFVMKKVFDDYNVENFKLTSKEEVEKYMSYGMSTENKKGILGDQTERKEKNIKPVEDKCMEIFRDKKLPLKDRTNLILKEYHNVNINNPEKVEEVKEKLFEKLFNEPDGWPETTFIIKEVFENYNINNFKMIDQKKIDNFNEPKDIQIEIKDGLGNFGDRFKNLIKSSAVLDGGSKVASKVRKLSETIVHDKEEDAKEKKKRRIVPKIGF